MATVTYKRVRQREGKLVKMRVAHNGVPAGSVRVGSDLTVDVEPGSLVVGVDMQNIARAQLALEIATDEDQIVVYTGLSDPFTAFVDRGEAGSLSRAFAQASSFPDRPWWRRFAKVPILGLYANNGMFALIAVLALASLVADGLGHEDFVGFLGVAAFLIGLWGNFIVSTVIVRRARRSRGNSNT